MTISTESTTATISIRRRLILKNFLSLLAGGLVERVINLFTSVYARRVLGVIAIGQVSWAGSVVSYFELLVNPGFQVIAKREVARDPDRAEHYVMLLALLQGILAALSFGLAVAFTLVVPRPAEVRLLIILYALGLFLKPLDLSWLLQAHERMTPLAAASAVSSVLHALSLILLVHEPAHVVRYVLLAYPFRLGLYGFMLYYGLRYRLLDWHSLRPTLIGGWNLLHSALPIGLSQVAILLYYNSDAIFLGFTHGDEAVGLYSTAYNLMLVPSMLLAGAMLSAYFPALSRVAGDADNARRVSGEFLKAMVWLGFPIAALGWALGRHVIVFLFGQGFAPAGPLFEWLSLNTALIFFNVGYNQPLNAWNAQKLVFYCTLVGAISNVAANVILIPRFGPWGAVATTILAELVVMISTIWMRRSLYSLNWHRTLLAGIAVALPTAIVTRLLNTQIHWCISATVGLVMYGIGVIAFEKQNVLMLYSRVVKREYCRYVGNEQR
jgi:O-antigen/teichoic acid export membrane protein